MNPLSSLLMTTDWAFVVTFVIVSMVFGSIWYHRNVMGTIYARLMKLPEPDNKAPEGMGTLMLLEALSRTLYAIGLAQAFYVSGWGSLTTGLIFVVVVWFIFVFPAQLSGVLWTNADRKAIFVIGGNSLIQTIIAAVLWYAIFA